MSIRRRRTSCLEVLILAFLALACLAVVVGGVGFYLLPQLAEQAFGPPSPDLGFLQRVTTSLTLVQNQSQLQSALNPAGQPFKFEVRLGESANSVAQRLEENGLVRNGEAFRTYLIYSGLDTKIQAGSYELNPAMSAVEIAKHMQDATPENVTFNILAGWRAEEIAAALPTSGLSITSDEFLKLVRNPSVASLPKGWNAGESVEGYLMPGSYSFKRDVTAEIFLKTFVDAFDEAVTDGVRAGFTNHHLSLAQAVTLASIIQREAVLPEEQPMIASVFYNRLAAGTKLDSDPTVQYALGYNQSQKTWWTNPLSADDLKVDSPYNTYQVANLPPGPISNPSLSALQAVAYPAQTPYYYFRAACDGSGHHSFSKTYQEHLDNACP
jgi:UPF0755 protein